MRAVLHNEHNQLERHPLLHIADAPHGLHRQRLNCPFRIVLFNIGYALKVLHTNVV